MKRVDKKQRYRNAIDKIRCGITDKRVIGCRTVRTLRRAGRVRFTDKDLINVAITKKGI